MHDTKISSKEKSVILMELGDLRIGNCLAYNGDIVHVTSLSMDIDDEYTDLIGFCKLGRTIDEVCKWNRELADSLAPIPLTIENVVAALNGELVNTNPSKEQVTAINFRVMEFGDFTICEKYDGWRIYGHSSFEFRRLNYFHELQNVLFICLGRSITYVVNNQ